MKTSLRPVILVEANDEKGSDDFRRTYYTVIDGREVLLAPCANPYGDGALREVRAKVRELFGDGTVVELAESAL